MYRRQKPRARNPYDAIFSGSSEESLKNIEHRCQLKETSYTTRVRIRKAGEKKFGNGHLSVQGDEVSLRLLKFFGREEKIRFSRAQIDGVEFRNKGVRFQSVPTEMPSGEVDLTLEIMLKNDRSFSLHIGDEVNNRKMAKFNEICEILNGRNNLSGGPATRNISGSIHRI